MGAGAVGFAAPFSPSAPDAGFGLLPPVGGLLGGFGCGFGLGCGFGRGAGAGARPLEGICGCVVVVGGSSGTVVVVGGASVAGVCAPAP
jgi:hypothetical protein